MKTPGIIALLIAVVLCSGVMVAQEKPWFDTQNCAFCKLFAAEPGLLDHMTNEYHNISDGMLSITHIDKGYDDAFKRAQSGIGKIVQEMQTGKMPAYVCPHCSMIGQFTMMGVKQEQVNSSYGIITLYQSSDSVMVAKVQDFGKRSAEELAKSKKQSTTEKGSKGK